MSSPSELSTLSLETCTSNLKSVALTVLGLIAFNALKFRKSRDHGYVPFRKNIKGSCPDCRWEHARQNEVRSFNRFKLVRLTGPLRTDTSNENSISAIRSVYLSEIKNKYAHIA